ncbi:MAG: carboxypeptidase-like regulatory domain-containing protein [Vicinamibacterales bacterium]
MSKLRVRLTAGLTVLVCLICAPVAAQVTTGTIVGTVSDSNGIVPGASVTIKEISRGTSDLSVTDANGIYTAPFLSPGTYVVEVTVAGFKKWVRTGVVLQVNQRARVDVTLDVGGIEETTTVEYLRDDAFDARNFFVRKLRLADGSLQVDPKPPLNRHQFGGAAGGALVVPVSTMATTGLSSLPTMPACAKPAGRCSSTRCRPRRPATVTSATSATPAAI